MKLIIGIAAVLLSVFGGFVLSKGQLAILIQPVELLIILGAAMGAMFISTPLSTIKRIIVIIARMVKGHNNHDQIRDTLSVLQELFRKCRKEGMMALDQELNSPGTGILSKYPNVYKDAQLITFITDYFRMMISSNMNAFEIESVMDVDLEARHDENMAPADAMATLGEGLPAFGIVAAVLGVVITMSSIGGPMEETGMHVAHALVGTMLGILLAYGFASPIAHAMEHTLEENDHILNLVKTSMIAFLNGYSPALCVEFGRLSLPLEIRPEFEEMELILKDVNKVKR